MLSQNIQPIPQAPRRTPQILQVGVLSSIHSHRQGIRSRITLRHILIFQSCNNDVKYYSSSREQLLVLRSLVKCVYAFVPPWRLYEIKLNRMLKSNCYHVCILILTLQIYIGCILSILPRVHVYLFCSFNFSRSSFSSAP